MKVYFDTNVLIDVFTNRDEESKLSIFCYRLVLHGLIKGYINAKQLSDIYYVLNKNCDNNIAFDSIKTISSLFEVVPYTAKSLINSETEKFNDIEDGSIDNCAKIFCCDYLITRNIKDFKTSSNNVLTPKEFITLYKVTN